MHSFLFRNCGRAEGIFTLFSSQAKEIVMALSSALREAARQQKEANQAKGSKMRNLKSLIGFSHKKAPESSPQQVWPLIHLFCTIFLLINHW